MVVMRVQVGCVWAAGLAVPGRAAGDHAAAGGAVGGRVLLELRHRVVDHQHLRGHPRTSSQGHGGGTGVDGAVGQGCSDSHLLTYVPTWLLWGHQQVKNEFAARFLFALANVPGNVASFLLIDVVGRRRLLASSLLLASFFGFIFTACTSQSSVGEGTGGDTDETGGRAGGG